MFRQSRLQPLPFVSDPAHTVPPFAVAHPPMYDGTGGVLDISVCVLTGSEVLEGPTSRAIQTWNELVPTIESCTDCLVWEESPSSGNTFHAETTLLHELGHCPLGLDHPDRNWDAADDGIWEPTSFTRSWDVAGPPLGIQAGADFIRGTLDDEQVSLGGVPPDSVHWFRVLDNNPFAIDTTVIDDSTFSRSVAADLPAGHSWAANGNRVVGEALGIQNSQSVMYSLQDSATRRVHLTSDDVNMVKMGMTGIDWESGTADDYTVQMHLVSDCVGADVIISFGEPVQGALAACGVGVDFSFPQNPLLTRHISLVPIGGTSEPLLILLDQAIQWITDESLVFSNGFESGDLSGWDNVVQ